MQAFYVFQVPTLSTLGHGESDSEESALHDLQFVLKQVRTNKWSDGIIVSNISYLYSQLKGIGFDHITSWKLHELSFCCKQLSKETRICFRDAMYRLAKSSMQNSEEKDTRLDDFAMDISSSAKDRGQNAWYWYPIILKFHFIEFCLQKLPHTFSTQHYLLQGQPNGKIFRYPDFGDWYNSHKPPVQRDNGRWSSFSTVASHRLITIHTFQVQERIWFYTVLWPRYHGQGISRSQLCN